jgi:hypothetical protein
MNSITDLIESYIIPTYRVIDFLKNAEIIIDISNLDY